MNENQLIAVMASIIYAGDMNQEDGGDVEVSDAILVATEIVDAVLAIGRS